MSWKTKLAFFVLLPFVAIAESDNCRELFQAERWAFIYILNDYISTKEPYRIAFLIELGADSVWVKVVKPESPDACMRMSVKQQWAIGRTTSLDTTLSQLQMKIAPCNNECEQCSKNYPALGMTVGQRGKIVEISMDSLNVYAVSELISMVHLNQAVHIYSTELAKLKEALEWYTCPNGKRHGDH